MTNFSYFQLIPFTSVNENIRTIYYEDYVNRNVIISVNID